MEKEKIKKEIKLPAPAKDLDGGIAAIIIQDMAILEMDLPPIPLFASTYCIKEELHMCPNKDEQTKTIAVKEPLCLNDGKQKYRLRFNCRKCEMEIYF